MNSKFLIIICAFLFCQDSFAQSPWSLPKGEFNFGLGYSRKTAGKRWYPTSIDTKGTASGGGRYLDCRFLAGGTTFDRWQIS
ncbi:MAG: hypothetical protein IPG87_02550 [Saprospiraceae bacterium]|nr:hypothetical protein [Candidatus Vicinibacter affinis]